MRINIRRLRLEYALKKGDDVPITQMADELGMTRLRLSRLERGEVEEIRIDEIRALCDFFSEKLEREITLNDIVTYGSSQQKPEEDETNKRAALSLARV